MPITVDSLQFALFTEPIEGRTALTLWQKAFKSDPLGLSTLGGVSHANGIQGSYQLSLQAQRNRVDLLLAAAGATQENDPAISDMAQATSFALKAIEKMSSGLAIERVALVAQRSKTQKDALAAVEEVKLAVPGLTAPPGATDLSYQTVISRNSSVMPTIGLTFIRRWNTGKRALVQVTLEGGQPTTVGGPERIVSFDYVDVAVAQPRKLFPKRALALLEELADVVATLLSSGYDGLLQQTEA